jgi:predicted aconitase with swiveling domain
MKKQFKLNFKKFNFILLLTFIFISKDSFIQAQTCTIGSASSTTEFAVSVKGGASNTNNARGTILAAATTLNTSNSAVVAASPSLPLVLDFGRVIPATTPIAIAAARVSGTAIATVEYSIDNITFSSLGANISSAVATSAYYNYTTPAVGLRYVRITVTSGVNLYVDGARYIQNFALLATGGTANPLNAVGPVLAVGTTLSTANSVTLDNGSVLNLDLGRIAAAGTTLRVAASRNGAINSTATVSYSTNGTTFTNFGTGLNLTAITSTYTSFTVPAGGVRYIRITGTLASSFIDGVNYDHHCPSTTVNAVDDQQVTQNPGTATGNVLTNDQVPGSSFSLALVTNVSNGTLIFNTTNGTYSYTPNIGFDAVDNFTYRLCDAGPDGNILTTADNVCDVATVTLRSMFNCKSTLFYVPVPENEARDVLEDVNTGNNDPSRVYMGLSVFTEGLIIYDQWEDGYETNITAPIQPTTQIWGDGNLSNGIAPGFPTDYIPAGGTIILSNSLTSGHNNTSNYNPNAGGADATLQGTIDFDGKDKIHIAGDASLSKFVWGTAGTVNVIGGSVPPVSDWGTSYRLPIGTNTIGVGPGAEAHFSLVNFSVIARQANTVVTIDRDGNGTTDITVTLNEGETYYVDSRNNGVTTAVNQGATINATNPIQVYLLTGQFSSMYQARSYALAPTSSLSSTYFMPGVPNLNMRVYFYNPTASSITVTRSTAGGITQATAVPANGSAYQDVNFSGLGHRFTSTVPFDILSAVDPNNTASDWGFLPPSSTNISPIVLVSFAEGSDPTNSGYGTNNYTQVHVTPACNTFLYVDLNGDEIPDKVSFNNDLDVTDAVTIGGIVYNESTSDAGIPINQFQTITLGGPAGTLNGAKIWTRTESNNGGAYGCNIAAVWGQNGGPLAAPNIDAGYTLPKTPEPLRASILKPATVCPNNNSESIISVALNGTAPFKILIVNKTTGESQFLTTSSLSSTLRARNPGEYVLKINDNNCLSFESTFTIGKSTNCGTSSLNDQNSTWQDVNVSGNVLTNDFDPEGHGQSFGTFLAQGTTPGAPISTGATLSGVDKNGSPVATAGTLTFAANGTYTFDPAPDFIGTVTVPYGVCDNGIPSYCDTAFLLITVDPLPTLTNSVIANNDENVSYGNAVSNNLLINDADPQGNNFTVSSFTYDTDGDPLTPNVPGIVGGSAIPVGGVTFEGTQVANAGSFTLNADGSYTFTPAIGFSGRVEIPYSICDDATPQACATAVLIIDVLSDINGNDNDSPVANDDFAFTNINTPVSSNAISNDYDPNSDNTFSVTQIGGVAVSGATTIATANGSITIQPDGSYTYTPNQGYVGPDQIVYTICDNQIPAICTEATLYFLTGIQNSTVAVNDENSTWQDVNVSGGVLGNDFDAENNIQTFGTFLAQGATPGGPIASGASLSGTDKSGAAVTNAGVLTFDANGNYTFNPEPTFTGTVVVPYRICDNGNLSKCDTAYLTITVDPYPSVTNSVIANNDENVSYGSPVSNNVTVNDLDAQGNSFTVTAVTGGSVGSSFTVAGVDLNGNLVANAGTLIINADGTYTYTPATGFVGSINVPYTITDSLGATSTAVLHIDVLADANGSQNDPPLAGDDFAYTKVNTPVTSNFINNDIDPNTNPISVNGTTINTAGAATPIGLPVPTAQGGTVQFFANGTYTYTPPANYLGPDQVNYTICDVTAVVPQPLCNTATIHFLTGIDNSTNAVNDENSTFQDVNVNGGVLTNDFDAENHTQTFGTFLAQGVTPGAPIATGATVSGVDKTGAPVANAGTLTFAADGTYTFDPAPTFTGSVTVPYRVCDNGNLIKCDTAFLTITVDPDPRIVNSVIANNDENVSYGSAVGGNVIGNDRDPQANPVTVTAVNGVPANVGSTITVSGVDENGNTVPNAGTMVINSNGTYTYTPAPNFYGSINIPYTITDVFGATATAVLSIEVIRDPNGPLNNPPFAGDDFEYTIINTPVTSNFINNDNDSNGNNVTVNGVTINTAGPANPIGLPVPTAQGGTVQFYSDGTYLYTPPAGYTGPDQVSYTICDVTSTVPQPLCNSAIIHLLVGPVSSLPVSGMEASVRLNGFNSLIEWKTETEINSDFFVVESSIDNRTYTQIGKVAASGSSQTRKNYSYTDDISSLQGVKIIYYRIKQVDVDSKYAYSNVVVVRPNRTTGVKAWPNPFTQNINVSIVSEAATKVNVKLLGSNGQLLQTQSQQISKGTNQISLNNLDVLPQGIYLLKVEDANGAILFIEKFVKN